MSIIIPCYNYEHYLASRVKRHNVWLRLNEFVQPAEGETVVEMVCRHRTPGCSPSTGAVPSSATTIEEIIEELTTSRVSERVTRAIDHGSQSAMEQKRVEGYF